MLEHQRSIRVGPAQEPRGVVLRMPLLILVAGVVIEWCMAGLARGGLYW